MYSHKKAQQSKNRVHISWDILYVYLVSIFTADGSLISSLKEHCADKQKHFHKLVKVLKTKCDSPFSVKRKVVDAAYNAAILYSCESWLGASCIVMNTMYMGGIKALLGVETTTANDFCLADSWDRHLLK